jgi:hypothetical protein
MHIMPDPRLETVAAPQPNGEVIARAQGPALPCIDADRLTLIELVGRDGPVETWTVQLGPGDGDSLGGRTVVATKTPVVPGPGRERLRRRLAALAAVDDPCLLAPLGLAGLDDATWLLSSGGEGVSLRRLAAMATLSPSQVVVVGYSILAALAAVHDAGLHHGGVTSANVWILPTGGVRLGAATDISDPARRGATARRLDLEMASHLLVNLLPRPRASTQVRRREQATPDALRSLLEGSGLAAWGEARAALAPFEAAAGDSGTAPACAGAVVGLGALVPLLRRRDPAGSYPLTPRASADAPGAEPPAVELMGRRVGRDRTSAAPWVTPPLTVEAPPRPWFTLAAVVAAVVALIVAVLLGTRIAHRGGSTTAPGHAAVSSPGTSGSTSAAPAGPPAATGPAAGSGAASPPPGPSRAGDVIGVTVAPASGLSCAAATSGACTLVVHVYLRQHGSEPVAWHFAVVDRCSGATTVEPGSTVDGLPSYQYVYDTTVVNLPTAHPMTIYAVTSSPSVVASPPLLVTGATAC